MSRGRNGPIPIRDCMRTIIRPDNPGKVIDAEITAYAVDEEQEQIYYFVYADGLYVYDIKTERPGNSMMQEKKWVLQKCLMTEIFVLYNGEWVSYAKSRKNRNYA